MQEQKIADISSDYIEDNEQKAELATFPVKSDKLQQSDNIYSPERALKQIAGHGRFQRYAFILISLQYSLTGIILYSIAYLQKLPTFLCNGEVCSQSQACSSPNYQTHYAHENFIYQYELECKGKSEIGMIASSFFIGYLIGSFIFPCLADKFGRKKFGIMGLPLSALCLLIILYGKSLSTLYVAMILFGIRCPLNTQVAYIHLLQFTESKRINLYSNGVFILDSFAAILPPFYYQTVLSFHGLFYFAIILSLILFFISLYFLPESFRFLFSKGKLAEAKSTLLKIAKVNRMKHDPPYEFLDDIVLEDEPSQAGSQVKVTGSKNKWNMKLCGYLGIMSVNWFVVTLVSYGVIIGIKKIKADMFPLALANGIAEAISYILSYFFSQRFGRKKSIIALYFLTGLCSFSYQLVVDRSAEIMIVTLVMLVKLSSNALYSLVYLVTSQLFPTAYRGTIFGMGNVFEGVGGMMAPFLVEYLDDNFMVIFGVLSLFAMVLDFFLIETKGKEIK